jgi:hypothetical protein
MPEEFTLNQVEGRAAQLTLTNLFLALRLL